MKEITQTDIERINELHHGIKRAAKKALKDAIEIGSFFLNVRKEKDVRRGGDQKSKSVIKFDFGGWIETDFPEIGVTSVYRYMHLAEYSELLGSLTSPENYMSLSEAERLIRFHERREKIKNEQSPSLSSDANPLEQLEAKLSRYTIGLWQLRYLETEIIGMFDALELSSEQIQRALLHACRSHSEVQEEVMKTFSPYPRLLKSAK